MSPPQDSADDWSPVGSMTYHDEIDLLTKENARLKEQLAQYRQIDTEDLGRENERLRSEVASLRSYCEYLLDQSLFWGKMEDSFISEADESSWPTRTATSATSGNGQGYEGDNGDYATETDTSRDTRSASMASEYSAPDAWSFGSRSPQMLRQRVNDPNIRAMLVENPLSNWVMGTDGVLRYTKST